MQVYLLRPNALAHRLDRQLRYLLECASCLVRRTRRSPGRARICRRRRGVDRRRRDESREHRLDESVTAAKRSAIARISV